MSNQTPSQDYTGRFAPSPTGPLHFGSLVAAVASYVDAKANRGIWLIRMEDLDPAREPPEAAATILRQLEDFGMHSDLPVLFQSQRLDAYREALASLESQDLCFYCDCSRQKVKAMANRYDGSCRHRTASIPGDYAIRVRVNNVKIEFDDLIQGQQRHRLEKETGDFVIRRRDGLFAYQLAVVVDDAFQRVTRVIRGYDLLESTPRQIYLQGRLGLPVPEYGHVPVVTNELGQKLSKQHYADPISSMERRGLMHTALRFLGMRPPPDHHRLDVQEQLVWAIQQWDIQTIPKLANIPRHEPVI
jgi:glutamyl-Q tRNA(Asp) synthetase